MPLFYYPLYFTRLCNTKRSFIFISVHVDRVKQMRKGANSIRLIASFLLFRAHIIMSGKVCTSVDKKEKKNIQDTG